MQSNVTDPPQPRASHAPSEALAQALLTPQVPTMLAASLACPAVGLRLLPPDHRLCLSRLGGTAALLQSTQGRVPVPVHPRRPFLLSSPFVAHSAHVRQALCSPSSCLSASPPEERLCCLIGWSMLSPSSGPTLGACPAHQAGVVPPAAGSPSAALTFSINT